MTPEQAREAAAVMLAWADGKRIESRSKIVSAAAWVPKRPTGWLFDEFEYRVAPEPWTGKIWVHPDGNSHFNYPTIDAEKWVQGGWRLITVKEVADE